MSIALVLRWHLYNHFNLDNLNILALWPKWMGQGTGAVHVKHLQHQPNQSKSNLSRQAPLSQQEADEKVISQQANQTLWLFHNRQDQTLWLFFVAVPLVIPQCIQSQSCTEDGNENPVLHTIPQQPQTSTLSSGSVA